MDKATAVQDTVNAAVVVAQVRNDYGNNSPEAHAAYQVAVDRANTARQFGASDEDFRTTRPA